MSQRPNNVAGHGSQPNSAAGPGQPAQAFASHAPPQNQMEFHQQMAVGGPDGAFTGAPGMMFEPDMIGAIKIKDGLFIGDELASTDLEFVVANKVTHIINCAGKQIQNHWEPIGVAYLTFFWVDQDNQLLLDNKDEAANAIFDFIEEALDSAESVLVHSVRGQSRATCALAAFIMRKYRWSLLKSLEFLNSRRPDLEIRATFINQLSAYEARLNNKFKNPITQKWDELSNDRPTLACEELLLRNTFVNSQMGPIQPLIPPPGAEDRKRAICWIDNDEEPTQGPKLETNLDIKDLRDKEPTEFVQSKHRVKFQFSKKQDVNKEEGTNKVISAIKPFELSINQLTGLQNFEDICKNPLAIPEHGQPGTEDSLVSRLSATDVITSPKDNDTNRQSQKHEKEDQRAFTEKPKPNQEMKTPQNIFYQKDESEPNMLNNMESDLDEVIQEVKPGSKAALLKKAQIQDSDDDAIITNKNGGKVNKGQKSNNFISANTTSTSLHDHDGPRKNARNNMSQHQNSSNMMKDESITDTDDEPRFKHQKDSSRRQAQNVPSKQVAQGNITNIINNNNINNFIIQDPSKAPQFLNRTQQFGDSTHPLSSNDRNNSGRQQAASNGFDPRTGQMSSNQPVMGQRPKKQAQAFRANSLTNRQKEHDSHHHGLGRQPAYPNMSAAQHTAFTSAGGPQGQNSHNTSANNPDFNVSGSQQFHQHQHAGAPGPGQRPVQARKRPPVGPGGAYMHQANQNNNQNNLQNGNQGVTGLVKNEMLRRNESPRNRRQLVNNLGMNAGRSGQQRPQQNRLLSGGNDPSGGSLGLGSNQHSSNSGQPGSSDMTFFDNKMFPNSKSAKSQTTRAGSGHHPVKFGLGSNLPTAHSTDQAPHFFNKSGPIKIQHHNNPGRMMASNPNSSTQSQQNQVEDMFNAPVEETVFKSRGSHNKTQNVHNLELNGISSSSQANRQKSSNNEVLGSGGHNPRASNRGEQNSAKPQNPNGQGNRPGTAPQQLNALLGGGQSSATNGSNPNSSKGNRPMSPFNKVYNNQLAKQVNRGSDHHTNGMNGTKPKKSASQDPRRAHNQRAQGPQMMGPSSGTMLNNTNGSGVLASKNQRAGSQRAQQQNFQGHNQMHFLNSAGTKHMNQMMGPQAIGSHRMAQTVGVGQANSMVVNGSNHGMAGGNAPGSGGGGPQFYGQAPRRNSPYEKQK